MMHTVQGILVVALTLDGKIARHTRETSDWTSRQDKEHLRSLIETSDAVVVGRHTYTAHARTLAKRCCIVFTQQPKCLRLPDRHIPLLPTRDRLVRLADEQGWAKLCVLGGTRVYEWFFNHDMAHDLYVTVEPIVFGIGVPFLRRLSCEKKAHLVDAQREKNHGSVFLHYRIV